MKVYRGYRHHQPGSLSAEAVSAGCVVTVQRGQGKVRPLLPRLDIRDHSPTGFEWGYGGSGPAQLALALVADCCGRAAATPPIYQRVKLMIVSALPHDGWTLTEAQVLAAVDVARHEADRH
jgi:hypothetical protein